MLPFPEATGNIKPILKHYDIKNGVVPISIDNLDTISQQVDIDFVEIIFTTYYKLNINNDEINFDYKQFREHSFYMDCLQSNQNMFYFKVPLFLTSYTIEYMLRITVWKLSQDEENDEENELVINDSDPLDISSILYEVTIPSIAIASLPKIDDEIQYRLENAPSYCGAGCVLQLLPNDMIEIQTEDDETLQLHKSKVLTTPVLGNFVIDTIDLTQTRNELIFRNKNICKDTYETLYGNLHVVYCQYIDIEYEDWNFNSMANFVAICIVEFLWSKEYNYKIQCIFDSNYLTLSQMWSAAILRYYEDARHGKEIYELQEFESIGCTCDICRIEVSWYDLVYKCNSVEEDIFCVSCIHSMVVQHKQMKQLLSLLLTDVVNDDCIEQIVTFCVGKVIKFDV